MPARKDQGHHRKAKQPVMLPKGPYPRGHGQSSTNLPPNLCTATLEGKDLTVLMWQHGAWAATEGTKRDEKSPSQR